MHPSKSSGESVLWRGLPLCHQLRPCSAFLTNVPSTSFCVCTTGGWDGCMQSLATKSWIAQPEVEKAVAHDVASFRPPEELGDVDFALRSRKLIASLQDTDNQAICSKRAPIVPFNGTQLPLSLPQTRNCASFAPSIPFQPFFGVSVLG